MCHATQEQVVRPMQFRYAAHGSAAASATFISAPGSLSSRVHGRGERLEICILANSSSRLSSRLAASSSCTAVSLRQGAPVSPPRLRANSIWARNRAAGPFAGRTAARVQRSRAVVRRLGRGRVRLACAAASALARGGQGPMSMRWHAPGSSRCRDTAPALRRPAEFSNSAATASSLPPPRWRRAMPDGRV